MEVSELPHTAHWARPPSREGERRSLPGGRLRRRPSRVWLACVVAARTRRRSTASQSGSETIRRAGASRSSGRPLPLSPGALPRHLLRLVPDDAARVERPAENLANSGRCPRAGAAPRRRDAVGVEPLRDARESVALGVEREDPPHDRRLGLVDHAMDVAAPVTLVAVAEDTAARDGAGLGPPPEGVIRPLPRAPTLEARGQGVEDRMNLARLVGEADRGVAQVGANLDAGLLDAHDGVRRPDGVAADTGQLRDDDHAERRAGLQGGEEAVEAGPVLPLRAGRVLVDEDIARVDRPALPLGVRRRALDLPPRRARLRVAVAIVGRLPAIEGGDHDSASPFVIVVEVLPRVLEERRHPAGPGR